MPQPQDPFAAPEEQAAERVAYLNALAERYRCVPTAAERDKEADPRRRLLAEHELVLALEHLRSEAIARRSLLLAELREDGVSVAALSRMLGVSRTRVATLLERARAAGRDPRPGRDG